MRRGQTSGELHACFMHSRIVRDTATLDLGLMKAFLKGLVLAVLWLHPHSETDIAHTHHGISRC